MKTDEPDTTKKHKDITRIDQESKRTHGWYVRVNFQGEIKTKFFSDRKNGGRDKSLIFAISWRNKTEKNLGKIRTDKHVVTVSKTKTSTGVVGVQFNEKQSRYSATWVTPEGKQKKTSFLFANMEENRHF